MQFCALLKALGLALAGGDSPQPKNFADLLERIRARPDVQLLQTVLLRSMQQAVYSPHNVGHFGLAYDAYAHFTSPIRRYPDLLVHRAIKAVLRSATYEPQLLATLDVQDVPRAVRRQAGRGARPAPRFRCGRSPACWARPTSGAPAMPRAMSRPG